MKKYTLSVLFFILFITVVKGQEVVNLTTIESNINHKEANIKGMKSGNEAKIIWSENYKEKQSRQNNHLGTKSSRSSSYSSSYPCH